MPSKRQIVTTIIKSKRTNTKKIEDIMALFGDPMSDENNRRPTITPAIKGKKRGNQGFIMTSKDANKGDDAHNNFEAKRKAVNVW